MSLGRVWYYLIVDWRAAVPRSGRVGPTSKRRVSTSPLKFYEELKSSASAGFESRNDDCQDFYFDNYIPADSKDEAGVIVFDSSMIYDSRIVAFLCSVVV